MKNIYRKFSVRYSVSATAGEVLTVDYRVAALGTPYPAALGDVIHAYQWLVKETPTGRARWWLPVIPQRRPGPGPVSLPQGPWDASARRAGAHVPLGRFDMQR